MKVTITTKDSGHHLNDIARSELVLDDTVLVVAYIIAVDLKVQLRIEMAQVQAEVPLFLARRVTAQFCGQLESAQIHQVVTGTLILQIVAVVHFWTKIAI